LLVNAGYAYWWGGATIGPRHLTPALGFLALALAFSPVEGASAYARTFRILLALGIFINFAMVLTGMDGPERRGTFTLFEIVLPGLLTSHLYTLAYRHWGIPLDLTFTLYTLPLLAVPVLFAIARVNAVLAGRDAALARYRPWVLEAIEVFSGDRPKGRDPDWLVALCRARGVAIVAGICAFGFIIRAVAAMAMDGAHWPDEIYQSLEQGHRLAFGYGIVPWEFRSGARSPLIVWFTAGIMWPVEALGGGPRAYVDAVRLSLAATSLAMIYCAWRLGARLSFTHALVAAFVAAVWFEFVYFSHRPLTESIAATLLVVGLTLLSTGNGEATRRRFFAAGVALGACAAFRFHLAPALAVAAIWACWDHGTARGVPLAVGAAIMLALAGIADWIYWGAPFHSYFVNFWVNLIEGKASTFGTSRWFFYPQHAAVFWQGAIPVIVALIVFGARRYPMWLVVAVVVVATHTLIPHKEYRFVYPAVACAVMLAAIGSGDLLRAVLPHLRTRFGQVLSIICALVVWGTVSLSLANSSSFSPEWTRYRTMIRATLDLHDEDRMCGLAVPYIPWTTWAGYVHLHRDLLVCFPTPEEAVAERAPSYNFMLVNEDHSTLLPKGYTRVSCRRAGNVFNTCTYRRPSGCVYDGENDIRRLLSE